MLETLHQEIENLPPEAQERLLKIVAELKQEYSPSSEEKKSIIMKTSNKSA